MAACLVLLLLPLPARADDLPYPPGRSEHVLEGSRTALLVPDGLSARKPASFVLILHGMGDNGPNLINALAPWREEGYVVCAPSAAGQAWAPADLEKAKKIALHVLEVLPIDRDRIHVLGFSNGGWNLAPMAFDDDLRPVSATWVAAGFKGGSVPKWAKKRLGVLALAGTEDGNAQAAAQTVPALRDKVRCVEARFQKGLGHAWPREHDAYLKWWMGAMEGRFVPGVDMNFAWGDDLQAAVAALAGAKKGGVLVYVFSPEDQDRPEAKALQDEVFMDPLVRHYGGQLQAVKLEPNEETAALGAKTTPAVVILDVHGKPKKVLEGKIKASSLASALRSVAPNRRRPS